MILTGEQIRKSVLSGEIIIDPFDDTQVGPNSYDFRLGSTCLIYKNNQLDNSS
jgi:deoxycytidine triphosphate deaminase